MPETPHERMPTLERFDRYGEDARTPVPRGRVTMPAGRVLIVLLVALRMGVDLFIRPDEIYTVQ